MDCIFCKIIKKEIPSKPVFEDDQVIAFKDINPQAPTHILIVPKRHIEQMADTSTQDEVLIGRLHLVARAIAQKLTLTDYRLVINNGAGAGQSVWHLHLHLLAGRPFAWPPG